MSQNPPDLVKNWYQGARLRALESLAYWKGRINTSDLIQLFGITRISAQKDIRNYVHIAHGNLAYRPKERAYVATSIFKNYLTEGSMDELMQLEPDIAEYVPKPQFHINPELARPLLQAIKAGQGVTVIYQSMEHPEGTKRNLFPHTLVYSGFRWHVRAWCCTRESFRDFNLARITRVELIDEKATPAWQAASDEDWNNRVKIQLAANPKLNDNERMLIESEFGMSSCKLSIECRAALVMYTLQSYQVDIDDDDDPRKQRLVLVNREAIRQYLWNKE